jgi:hypothetical protein
MIPDWEEEFDLKAANELKESILEKDLEKIKIASEALQKTCFHCHFKKNTSVWARYYWPSTNNIKVLDPLDEKELSYNTFLKKLSDSLKRISLNFEQEDFQQAFRSLKIFKKDLQVCGLFVRSAMSTYGSKCSTSSSIHSIIFCRQ